MTAYIIRRLILAVVVLLITSVIVFLAMRLLPGDPILLKMTSSEMRGTSPEQIELVAEDAAGRELARKVEEILRKA